MLLAKPVLALISLSQVSSPRPNVAADSIPLPAIRLEVDDESPNAYLARDHCLTAEITSAASWTCGSLRVVHTLPAVVVRGRRFIPALQYDDQQAHPFSLVGATITLTPTVAAHTDSVHVAVLIDGRPVAERSVSARHWSATSITARRVALGVDMAARATGVYAYTLLAAAGSDTARAAGRLVVINRAASPLGAGWSLAGVEQLVPLQPLSLGLADSLLWVGGDGSAHVYRRHDAWRPVFYADRFTRPDSILQKGDGFMRPLPHSGSVQFDPAGYNRVTRDATGNAVTFDVDTSAGAARLTRVHVAGPRAELVYTFEYRPGDAAGPNVSRLVLDRVDAPRSDGMTRRTVRATIERGALTALRDPDETVVAFAYDRAVGALTQRVDRRGVAWTFAYDGASRRLRAAWADVPEPASSAGPASVRRTIHTFGAAGATGLAAWSPDPIAPLLVHAWHDGPRDDVNDVTRVWLDRFGQPAVIRAAAGGETHVARDDPRFPGLVTRVTGPTGLVTTSAYDERGNATSVTVRAPLGDGRDATTRYAWDPRWDALTESVTPQGVVTRFGYDSITGARVWLEDGRGTAGRVRVYANASGLVDSVRTPLAHDATRYTYDALGNLADVWGPGRGRVRHLRDAIGRDTVILAPLDDAAAPGDVVRTRRVAYDLADRVVSEEETGPATRTITGDAVSAETLRVLRAYDAEGNLVSIDRAARPDRARTGGALHTTWTYDALGRAVVERAPDGFADSSWYDVAGNIVRRITRRGHPIAYAYDAANRLVERRLPAVHYPAATIDGSPFPDVDIPADTERFAYDTEGRVLRAANGTAVVRRHYYPGGALASDTMLVRALEDGDSMPSTSIRYAYDLDGRRITLSPSLASGDSLGTIAYAYDIAGALANVTDPLGQSFGYEYDLEGRVARVTSPRGVSERAMFDDAGRLAARSLVGASAATSADTLRAITLVYDARDKVRRARTVDRIAAPGAAERIVDATYSGLGALTQLREIDVPVTGRHAVTVRDESFESDVFGQTMRAGVSTDGAPRLQTDFTYSLHDTGRLLDRREVVPGTTGSDHAQYDAAGNRVILERRSYVPGPGATGRATLAETSVDYYDAAERLRVSDARAISSGPDDVGASSTTRVRRVTHYDALGRRLTLDTDDGASRSHAQFVWDDDQLLGELTTTSRATAPHDFAAAIQSVVLYTHGAGLDDPVSVIRRGLARIATRPTPVSGTLVGLPHRDWRGRLDLVLDTLGRALPDDSARALGSLLDVATGPAGDRYQRARYFDPLLGRFTQEDPLGAVGGPSAYGVGGDPITYADPFGLCRVEVRYARLGAFLGRAYHHAYVVTTAPDLTRLFFRGGPSAAGPSGGAAAQLGVAVSGVVASGLGLARTASGGGAWGTIRTLWGNYEPGAIDWDPGDPPATQLVDDATPCDGYVASFTRTLDAIANRRIAYNPFTTNSNAVVRELLAKAGLSPGSPIVWVPGWGTGLLR